MAKFSGMIGFVKPKKVSPGVWENEVVEKRYFGDVLKNYNSNSSSGYVLDNVELKHTISIVADGFIRNNLSYMRYARYGMSVWNITTAVENPPRVEITLGGVYTGPQDQTTFCDG